MAHQNAGKEHRKRCQGTAQHAAMKLNAHSDTKRIVVLEHISNSCLCPCQRITRWTRCRLMHSMHTRSISANNMKCFPVGTADRLLSMPTQSFRLRWPTCSQSQQQPHVRRRAQPCARCCRPGSAPVLASDRHPQPAAAPVFSLLASAAALPVLLAPGQPASAADELPAATGAQASETISFSRP